MARWLGILTMIVGLLLSGVVFSVAAQKTLKKSTPKVKSTIPMRDKAADLAIPKAAWSKPPREGDPVGGSPILSVMVANKGSAPANGSALKIECTALTGSKCPASVKGTVNVPALGPGKSTMISWPSLSSEKWPAGRFRLNIKADAQNRIKESNERNNAAQINFSVYPNPQKKVVGMQPSSFGIKKKRLPMSAAQPTAQIQPLNTKITASKIRAKFETVAASLYWSMDIVNKGTGIIPADALEYRVSQTRNNGNPVTMTKGSIHQALTMGQSMELKGDFMVCCGYDGMAVEIRNKQNGSVLSTVGARLPVEPARARVQVAKAVLRTNYKPTAPLIIFKNNAAMPIKVKATVFRNPPDAANDYILADERQFWIFANDSTTENYTGKIWGFDKLRVKITQVCPVIMCSKDLCTEFPTWEGSFWGDQDN
jgi:hypothetical protein